MCTGAGGVSRLLAGAEPGALGPGLGEENTGGPVLRRLKHRGALSWGHSGIFILRTDKHANNFYKEQVICYRKSNTINGRVQGKVLKQVLVRNIST